MRILIDATAACRPVRTGIARYTVELVDALAPVAAEYGDELQLGYRISRWKHRHQRYLPPGIAAHWVAGGVWPLRPRTDLIHTTESRISVWPGVARVSMVHDIAVLMLPGIASERFRERMTGHLRTMARHAHRLIAVSECSRRDFLERFDMPPERVEVVYLAISQVFRPVDEAAQAAVRNRLGVDGPYLLYVGELSRRKNIDRLLEGYARCALRDDLPLVLVGPLSYGMDDLEQRLDTLGLRDRVVRPGYVENAHLPALYGAAAAFVFPTLYEGFGLPALEAMACGTPVVGGIHGATPEVTAGHATLVDPYDPASIAQGIEQAVDMPQPAREAAAAHARGFTWDACARGHHAVYRHALAAR